MGIDKTGEYLLTNFFEILYQFLGLFSAGSLSLGFFFLNPVLLAESGCPRTFSA